jgi:NTP pyrophosphatase (non-canonical NTP hydrolase)
MSETDRHDCTHGVPWPYCAECHALAVPAPSPSPGATAPLTEERLSDQTLADLAADIEENGPQVVHLWSYESIAAMLRELLVLRSLRDGEEGRRVRPEVLAFAQAMEVELRENDGKGGWEDCGTEWLLHRMTEERRELTEAVKRRHAALGATSKRETAAAVLSEAADVANFAMMIADVCGALALAPSPSLPDAPLPDGRDATRGPNPCASPRAKPKGRNGDESVEDHDAPEFCVCGWRMDAHAAPRATDDDGKETR